MVLFPAVLGLLVSGCGASSPESHGAGQHPTAEVTVRAAALPGAGSVLVNARGYVLYAFMPDGGGG